MGCGGRPSECEHVCVHRGQLSISGIVSQTLSKLSHITTSLTVLELTKNIRLTVQGAPAIYLCFASRHRDYSLAPLCQAFLQWVRGIKLRFSFIHAKIFFQLAYFPCPRSLFLLSSTKTFVYCCCFS